MVNPSQSALDERRQRRLIEVGRTLTAELDLEAVLRRVLEAARELTDARYAALGIVGTDRRSVDRFLFTGIDDETAERIGELPRGRGVLGLLIEDPRPIRMADVGAHPKSYGFPPGHPPMHCFLGVPIEIRGQAYGNLYLTEKPGGAEFDAADEEAAITLAQWAAIAIDNARLMTSALERREELERAVARLEATSEIARAVGGETRLDRILETIVKRGRALVEARTVIAFLEDRGQLVVAAAAGEAGRQAQGRMLPIDGAAWRRVMSGRRAERVDDIGARLGMSLSDLGVEARAALLVPLVFRGRAIGMLAAFDRAGSDSRFYEEDEALLEGFAASAAMAVATAQSMAEQRLRESIQASERERARWARELHDETLQGLGALRVRLAGALRSGQLEPAVREAVAQIEGEIANLRALITELRPAALDELGLRAAIESLAESFAARTGVQARAEIDVLQDEEDGGRRLDRELESAIYRLVQEGLTNVAKHADADEVRIEVTEHDEAVEILVRDDGVGFDMDKRGHGFGLVGMRERVALLGGSLSIVSTPGAGTELRGRVPVAGTHIGRPEARASG